MSTDEPPPGSVVAVELVSRTPLDARPLVRPLVVEAPVSIEFNGLAYAVMMATPVDLDDFAVGFALCEGVAGSMSDIREVDIFRAELGWIVRVQVTDDRAELIRERIRRRVADGGCGLCGVENLEQALRPLPRAAAGARIEARSIFWAIDALRSTQRVNAATGAAHAAAFCLPDGTITAVREDVGRHNAFDKLIGSLASQAVDPACGFALLSSRCSYELVDKALMTGFSTLVTISAPTSLAVERARLRDLTLVSLARSDAFLVSNDPNRWFFGQEASGLESTLNVY